MDRTCLPALPELPDSPTPEEQAEYDTALLRQSMAEDTAVMVLWAFTGRQFGICETTVRPCPERNFRRNMRSWRQALLFWDGSHWLNGSCGCTAECDQVGPGLVHLLGPAQSIVNVTIGEDVLDESEYVLEGNVLYRRGGQAWPRQDLTRPMGEPGTWSVTYERGLAVPPGGDKMAGVLAQEFIAACDADGECRLPRTVVQTVRQGVTHVFDASAILKSGAIGIPEIDLWVHSINPNNLMQAPVVL